MTVGVGGWRVEVEVGRGGWDGGGGMGRWVGEMGKNTTSTNMDVIGLAEDRSCPTIVRSQTTTTWAKPHGIGRNNRNGRPNSHTGKLFTTTSQTAKETAAVQ